MSEPKPTYDSVWKALPDAVILALVRLVVAGVGTKLQPWKTDIKQLFDRDIDNAYLIEIDGIQALLLLEYQNYLDLTMPWRVFEYITLLKLGYHQQQGQDIPVLAIVIWATPGQPPAPRYTSGISEATSITSRYLNIVLRELDWQGVDPLLLVLAPFFRGMDRSHLKDAAIRMYEAAPVEHRTLLLGALLNLSRRRYQNIDEIEQEILAQVRITMDEIYEAIEEGPIGIKILEKGKAQGIAEGKAQGKAQGISEGKVQGITMGERTAITIFWQRRFGQLAPEVTAALDAATEAQLHALLEALAGQPTEAEARALLGL